MNQPKINILLADTSQIIVEGLYAILKSKPHYFNISVTDSISGIKQFGSRIRFDAVVLNPSLIQNNIQLINQLKESLCCQPIFFALVYAYYEPCLLSAFDAQINISDTSDILLEKIEKQLNASQNKEISQTISLSERETEVLRLLVNGNSNKEIADKLNISTHTVITHRKNISQKTGIKSVSGLTIYAVVQHIISIENLKL